MNSGSPRSAASFTMLKLIANSSIPSARFSRSRATLNSRVPRSSASMRNPRFASASWIVESMIFSSTSSRSSVELSVFVISVSSSSFPIL